MKITWVIEQETLEEESLAIEEFRTQHIHLDIEDRDCEYFLGMESAHPYLSLMKPAVPFERVLLVHTEGFL